MSDWKQTNNNSLRQVWVNQDSNRVLAVEEETTHWNDSKYKGKWMVSTGEMDGYATTLLMDVSRSEAMAFGKKFMEEN